MILCISVMLVVTSLSFMSLFGPCLFFLDVSCYRFIDFYLFREPAFSFIDLFLLFYLFSLWFLVFYPFSCLWAFPPSFPSYFRCIKLDCWLGIFLVFWDRPVLLWTSLLELLLLHPIDFGKLYFHFQLSRGIFSFLVWFYHWTIVFFFIACCLVSRYWSFFLIFIL